MKKLLLAGLVSLAFAGTASADQIYINNGVDYGGNSNKVVGNVTTGWKNSLDLTFISNSVIDDVNGNGDGFGIEVGDTITSSGGLISGAAFGSNYVTALIQGSIGGGPSDNGYGDPNWALSFRFDDLMGTFDGTNFNYTSGTIDWLLFDASNGFDGTNLGTEVHLFSTSITSHSYDTNGHLYEGYVHDFGVGNVNGVPIGDIFNIAYGAGAMGFEEYTETISQNVRFRIDQNTDTANVPAPIYNANDQTFEISNSAHNGSIMFDIPEPTSIAILGLGLLGFAASRRRV